MAPFILPSLFCIEASIACDWAKKTKWQTESIENANYAHWKCSFPVTKRNRFDNEKVTSSINHHKSRTIAWHCPPSFQPTFISTNMCPQLDIWWQLAKKFACRTFQPNQL